MVGLKELRVDGGEPPLCAGNRCGMPCCTRASHAWHALCLAPPQASVTSRTGTRALVARLFALNRPEWGYAAAGLLASLALGAEMPGARPTGRPTPACFASTVLARTGHNRALQS